jgi:2-polyprenyl-3-methyl-5-hydroxy-6-metoxy-1,4-benzoquinol methylase
MSQYKYRKRIYAKYATICNPEMLFIDLKTLNLRSKALTASIKNWLPINKNIDCLDVACGSGLFLYSLKTLGYKNIKGVDRSAEQIKIARNFCSSVQIIDAIVFLNKNKNKFDLITAFDIIEHFKKDEILKFIEAIYFALKPGGRLILQTPNADSPFFGAVRYGDFTHEISLTPKSLAQVLSIYGFSKFEAQECVPYVHGFKSFIRSLLWKLLHCIYKLLNSIETGSAGSKIYSRVFIAKSDKPKYVK